MEGFIREYSVSPNQYCREKEFATTGFTTRITNIRHHYHLFRANFNRERKGTAILIHGYSCHTLGEYLNIVENEEYNSMSNGGNYYYYDDNKRLIENPLLRSKYITTYKDSYIEYFNNNGYDVLSLDLEGHGFSRGKKCNTCDLDNNCYSIVQMMEVEMSKHRPNGRSYLSRFNVSVYNWNCNTSKGGEATNASNHGFIEAENKFAEANMLKSRDIQTQLSNKKGICIHCGCKECIFTGVFGEKVIICGVSMGGATALRLVELIGQVIKEKSANLSEDLSFIKCIKSRIVCTILLSPLLSLESVKKRPLNRFLLMFLSITSYLFPDLQIGEKIRNPSCEYLSLFSKNDPLCYSKRVKALMCKSLLSFTETIQKNINHYPVDIPLLICHCIHDSLTDFEGSKSTIESLNRNLLEKMNSGSCGSENGTENTEFTLWPVTSKKMWHALTREMGFQDLLLKILDWVSKKELQHEKKCKQISKHEKACSTNQQILISLKRNFFRNKSK